VKKILQLSILGLFLFGFSLQAQAATPAMLFSDLTDGPVSGWEGSSTKGAAVSVYVRNIDTTRGSSYITVGGVDLTNDTDYAEWGATTTPKVPVGMQRITFFLNSNMTTGGTYPNTTITLTTPDGTSEAIPFHTRELGENHIYIRNDQAATGWAREFLIPGDVLYLRAGTYNTADDDSDFNQAVNKGLFSFCYGTPKNFHDGEEGRSIAISAYPGEEVHLEAIDIANEHPAHIMQVYYGHIAYWTMSKMYTNALSTFEFKDNTAPPYDGQQSNLRFINLDMTTPYFPNTNMEYYDYGEAISFYFGDGSHDISVLGNYVHDIRADYRGQPPADPEGFRAYFMYLNGYGTMNHFEIGWNEFGWNAQSRGLQIFGHHEEDRIDNLVIHDNWIHDVVRQAIIMSGEGGDYNYSFIQNAYLYNNIIDHAGSSDPVIQMGAMYGNGKYGGTYYVYNNVFDGSTISDQAVLHIGSEIDHLFMENNIILGVPNDHDYIDYFPGDPINATKTTSNYNLWSGAGADKKPSWDTSILGNNSPQFVSTTFTNYADYRISEGSPARDSGHTNTYATKDFVNNNRPQGASYDIGAFEYVDSGPTVIRANVDQQNGITVTDALLTLRNSLGLTMTNTNWQSSANTGDVNCDNVTNSIDATLILRSSLGLDMGGTGWCTN
jgi:hypothetical protein